MGEGQLESAMAAVGAVTSRFAVYEVGPTVAGNGWRTTTSCFCEDSRTCRRFRPATSAVRDAHVDAYQFFGSLH